MSEEMDEPVPCAYCGDIVELRTLNFNAVCQCWSACIHGVCDACVEEYGDRE